MLILISDGCIKSKLWRSYSCLEELVIEWEEKQNKISRVELENDLQTEYKSKLDEMATNHQIKLEQLY